MVDCHRCHRPTEDAQLRPVPFGFRLIAALSLGPVHAGMWLWEELSRLYCVRCRRWLSFLSLVLASMVAYFGLMALRWGIKEKIFPDFLPNFLTSADGGATQQ